MTRRPLTRRRARSRHARRTRPGNLPGLPKDWSARCRAVWTRDEGYCRRCGQLVVAAPNAANVDHIIPRRLGGSHEPENLALNDVTCHGLKVEIEAALLRGDPYAFFRYLEILSRTGPVPRADQIGAALTRLQELLEETPA